MIPLAALHALSMSTHCNDLPPWSYSHIDSLWPPGSGEACKNPYGQCATAGTPSDDAAYKFLRQLQPYHSCINSTHNADLAIRTAPKTLCPGKFVIDVFHIAYELDVLEIRLAELYTTVDLFVIVESTRTSRLQPKPLYVLDAMDRFKQFHQKILYRVIDDDMLISAKILQKSRNASASRRREDVWSNDSSGTGFTRLWKAIPLKYKQHPNVMFIAGDADEIPSAELVQEARCKTNPISSPQCTRNTFMYINNADRMVTEKPQQPSQAPTFFAPLKPSQKVPRTCHGKAALINHAYHLGGFLNEYGTLAKEISAAEGGGIMIRYASALQRVKNPSITNSLTALGIRTCCNDPVGVPGSGILPLGLKLNQQRYPHLFPLSFHGNLTQQPFFFKKKK